jgi:hypothetical protein
MGTGGSMSNNNQQYAIIEIPPPGVYRDAIKADAIVIGPLDEAMTAIKQSVSAQAMLRRLDEGQKEAARTEQQQAETRTRQILTFCDSVGKLSRRMDQFEAELAIKRALAAEEQERKDTLRIRHRIEAALDDLHSNTGDLSPLPDPSDPDASLTDDQEGFATRQEPDPANLAHPPIEEHPQPLAVQLNEA